MATAHARFSTADEVPDAPPPAHVAAQAVTSFLTIIRSETARLGVSLLDPDDSSARSAFDVRVRPLALATLSRPFDHDPAVIAVFDEAQFRGRRVAIEVDAAGDAMIAVSAQPERLANVERSRGLVRVGDEIRAS